MWQSELFCFTCCLSRGVVSLRVCVCVWIGGDVLETERERASKRKGCSRERARSGNIHTACNGAKHLAEEVD